jgi:hypothetical protein
MNSSTSNRKSSLPITGTPLSASHSQQELLHLLQEKVYQFNEQLSPDSRPLLSLYSQGNARWLNEQLYKEVNNKKGLNTECTKIMK